MGVEAGQSLGMILKRKELERLSGGGVFAWGIGNSLGGAPALARSASPYSEVDVFFSPMKSAAKSIDVSPAAVLLWQSYVDAEGVVRDLPGHMAVTSRGDSAKESGRRGHYALLCHSDTAITTSDAGVTIDSGRARNFVSLNPLGASQVTAMVRYQAQSEVAPKLYHVAFSAKFHDEGFVRLANPVKLDNELARLYRRLCESESVAEWVCRVAALRELAALKRQSKGRVRQQPFWEGGYVAAG